LDTLLRGYGKELLASDLDLIFTVLPSYCNLHLCWLPLEKTFQAGSSLVCIRNRPILSLSWLSYPEKYWIESIFDPFTVI
jgi:hypothetical protein